MPERRTGRGITTEAFERALARHGFPASTRDGRVAEMLEAHARAVLEANDRLHLTSISDPGPFLTRHVEESAIGAAAVRDFRGSGSGFGSGVGRSGRTPSDPGSRPRLLDLGSGNGYPGIPLAALLPWTRPVLVEASAKKAEFLRSLAAIPGLARIEVLARQVQRPSDVPTDLTPIDLLATRAMGNWERVLPRLAPCLAGDARVLLWAGDDAERIFDRKDWRARFGVVGSRPLPGRDRARLWILEPR